MNFDIVIPTRGDYKIFGLLLNAIDFQNVRPNNVFVLIDKNLDQDEFKALGLMLKGNLSDSMQNILTVICNLNSDFVPGKGVSYVRNYGIHQTTGDYVYILDDDNTFSPNFFEKTLETYQTIKGNVNKDFLLSPTIIYRDTNKIQSQGIADMKYFFPKLIFKKLGNTEYGFVKMIGGNSLFGPKWIFEKYKFDEHFIFAVEDLDFTYRVSKDRIPVIVSSHLKINHMERDKTLAEIKFVGDPKIVYQRVRNKIFFVRKNATRSQKIQFFGLGMWCEFGGLFIYILLFGKEKKKLMKSLFWGIVDGISTKLQ